MAWGSCRENGIRTSCKNEDIVGYQITCRGIDYFFFREDVGDSGVEMIIKRSVWK